MIFVALSIMTQDVQNSSENIFLTQIKTGDPNMLVVDESLETRTALACELLVTLDSDSIQLALKEKKSNRILALESFQLNQGNKGINWTDALEQLSRNSHLLRNFEFTKAIVGVFSPAYTLVPDAIYKAGDDKKFLDFHFEDKEKTRKIFSRQVNPFQLKTIFGISEELHHELFHLFEEPELIHPASTLLEAAHLQSRGKKEKEKGGRKRREKKEGEKRREKRAVPILCLSFSHLSFSLFSFSLSLSLFFSLGLFEWGSSSRRDKCSLWLC